MISIERFEQFSKIINQLSKELKRIKYKHMSKYDLGSVHTMCILSLSETTGKTAAELMQGEDVDKAQMSRVIKELCEKEFIKPVDGQQGKYRIKYELTEKGEEVAAEIFQKAVDIVKFVDEGISEEDIRIMYYTMYRICNNIIKAHDEFEK